jgi:hypothetical protein
MSDETPLTEKDVRVAKTIAADFGDIEARIAAKNWACVPLNQVGEEIERLENLVKTLRAELVQLGADKKSNDNDYIRVSAESGKYRRTLMAILKHGEAPHYDKDWAVYCLDLVKATLQ